MWKDFKAFIMRGNVMDMAIGIIIGGAFGSIVTSLVKDIIMPPIGLLLGRINFTDLYVSLNGQKYPSLTVAQNAGAATINYGLFINTVINFLIIAFAIFLVVRWLNRLQQTTRKPAPATVSTSKDCPYCYSSISIKATRCPNCTSHLT